MSIENETLASTSTEGQTAIVDTPLPPQKRPMDDVEAESQDPIAVKKMKTDTEASSTATSATTPQQSLSEEDVGITGFIRADLTGWSGILKARYSDFLVNEVDLDGNVLRLTSLDLPTPPASANANDVQEETKSLDTETGCKELETFMDEENYAKFCALVANEQDVDTIVACKAESEKERRILLHNTVKKYFMNKLTSETSNGTIIIRRLKPSEMRQHKARSGRQDERAICAARGGEFLYFHLYKENKDTMDAVNAIQRTLRLKNKNFGYAGTKDRRAITVQAVTVQKLNAEDVVKMNAMNRNIKVGNFKYVKEPLKLGQLSGNRFGITLRQVSMLPESDNGKSLRETIDESLTTLSQTGFINYFGMQRFGTHSVSTHVVGKILLESNWEAAVNMILMHRDSEDDTTKEARRIWKETKDAKKALTLLPRRLIAERSILEYFAKSPSRASDFMGAINSIPRNLRTIYVHAYQSYIWNAVTTERIAKFGLVPIVGDLVVNISNSSPSTNPEALDVGLDTETSDSVPPESMTFMGSSKWTVKVLSTPEECANYTIHDVVLPLPGHSVEYPKNAMFDKYKEMMAKDGLDPLDMRRKVKDFSLPGGYRYIVTKPKDLVWSLSEYEDMNIPLRKNDLDILNGASAEIPAASTSSENGEKNLAVVIEMTLPTSSYATMALREVMKQGTSAEFHTSLMAPKE